MWDIPWGDIISAVGPSLVQGAGTYFTSQAGADDAAARDDRNSQSAIDLANVNNAAALERLQMQLAQGDGGASGASRANAELAAKVNREKMLQDAFASIIQTVLAGRNQQGQAFNSLISASQNAALPR